MGETGEPIVRLFGWLDISAEVITMFAIILLTAIV